MPSRKNVIEVVINATDNASKVFDQLAGNTQEIGKAITTAFAGVAVGIGAATAAAVTKGLSEFQRFETGMNEVFTLLPGITQDAMDSMSSEVQSFSARMGVLSEDVVPALYQSLSAGVPQDNVFQFLEVAQKAALGGVTELETAVDGISSVVNAYGSEVIDATKASDLMFTAVRLGKTDFTQLSSSLFNVAPIAASMGIEFENVTAALATLTAQGVPTSVAATQLRSAFTEMADSGSEVGKAFQEVAGKSFRDFIAQGGNLADALDIVQQAAQSTGKPIDELFGSVEAAQAVLGLTGANAESFRNALNEMANSAGATDAAFEQMNQGIGRALDRLRATAQNFFVNLGKLAAPLVTPFIKGFSDLTQVIAGVLGGEFGMESFADLVGEIPGLFKPIARVLIPIAAGFRQFASDLDPNNPDGFFGALKAGIPLFGAIVTEIRRVMRAMGFSTGVINDVSNALITAWNWTRRLAKVFMDVTAPIRDWVKDNIELKDVLIAIGIAIASFVIPAIVAIATALAPVIATFAALVVGVSLLRQAWENDFLGIQEIVTTVFDTIIGLWQAFQSGGLAGAGQFFLDNVITPIVTAFQNIDWLALGSLILDGIGTALSQIGTLAQNAGNLIMPLFQNIVDTVQNIDWSSLGNTILTGITGAISGASTIATNIGNDFIMPLFDNMVTAVQNTDWQQIGSDILTFIGDAIVTWAGWVNWAVDNLLTPLFDNIKNAVTMIDWGQVGFDVMNAIGAAIVTTFNFIQWIIDSIFNPVGENAEGAASQTDFGRVGNAIMSALGNFFSTVFDFGVFMVENVTLPLIAGAVASISQVDWSGIGRGIMDAIGNAIPNIAEWVNNHIIQPIKDALSGFNPLSGVELPSAGNVINTGRSNIGSFFSQVGGALSAFNRKQFGGQVQAGVPVTVGETGRETFVPNQNGNILNAQDTVAQGGSQPINIVFNFNRSVTDREARESASKVKRELRANGIQVEGSF